MRSVDEIRSERRQLARDHDGRFPELAAASVDRLAENARQRANDALTGVVANAAIDGNLRFALGDDPESGPLLRVALLYLVSSSELESWLSRHVVEVTSSFASEMPLAEYERRMAALDAELVEATRAARAAPLLAQRDELDAELAMLETTD
jgi:hypothetical protein